MHLQYSKVQRGGVSSPYWSGETSDISTIAFPDRLQISFSLPSKGGGDTSIAVNIATDDLRGVFRELAKNCPLLVDAFTEAAHIATTALLAERKRGSEAGDA